MEVAPKSFFFFRFGPFVNKSHSLNLALHKAVACYGEPAINDGIACPFEEWLKQVGLMRNPFWTPDYDGC